MTREEAIEELERLLSHWDDLENGKRSFRWYSKDAVEVALSALRPVSREQMEKVWRGEWKPAEFSYMNECEDCSVCGYRTVWGHGFRFCPACGRAMTDEAVQMAMERLEALKDGKGD